MNGPAGRSAGVRVLSCSLGVFAAAAVLAAHDPITTRVTWIGEISRIVEARCASCHSSQRARDDVSRDLRRGSALGAGHQGRSPDAPDAEMARRARLRRLQQRSVALAVRDRAHRGLGRRWRAARHGGGRTCRRHERRGERDRTPAGGCARGRAPVWRAGGAGRNPARHPTRCSTRVGPSASRSGCPMAGGKSWAGYATSTRRLRRPIGCGCR